MDVLEHYEAITGADDLVWALLQLHCAMNRPDIRMEHIDVNWRGRRKGCVDQPLLLWST